MRKTPLINEQFYHIYNRGVDKRVIFNSDHDYLRLVNGLFYFNDSALTNNFHRALILEPFYVRGSGPNKTDERDRLVDIIAWSLMPNHFHLVLRQLQDGGISKFIQKLIGGYTTYFNLKYERSGVLFQGAFKAKHSSDDVYLSHLIRYVHLNPVSLLFPGWEVGGISNWNEAVRFLDTYKWSSHPDYQKGKTNFPELLNRDFLPDYPELDGYYIKFLGAWIAKDAWFSKL